LVKQLTNEAGIDILIHLPFAGTNRIRFRGYDLSSSFKFQISNHKFPKVPASKRLWNLIFAIWDLPDLHRFWAPHCVKNQC